MIFAYPINANSFLGCCGGANEHLLQFAMDGKLKTSGDRYHSFKIPDASPVLHDKY
jgi:hypothetical protein